jgi:hypothetical protein
MYTTKSILWHSASEYTKTKHSLRQTSLSFRLTKKKPPPKRQLGGGTSDTVFDSY